MNDEFAVVKMSQEHLERVCIIERECFSRPWTKLSYEAVLKDPTVVAVAAVLDGDPVGYATMQTVLDEGYFGNIAVTKAHRKRGIADKLIESLFNVAASKKLSFVSLEVRESNAAARALYEKHGFSYVGSRPGYYTSPNEDALLMTKFFNNTQEVPNGS